MPSRDALAARRIYTGLTQKKYYFIFALIVALAAVFLVDIMTGPAMLSLSEVISAMTNSPEAEMTNVVIVRLIRMPVAIMALVVGASLGLAGGEMQTILGNPLASPYTLGISAAAGFGAGLALILGVGVFPYAEHLLVPINAFFFSMLTSLIIYFLAKVKNAGSETIILTGIALLFLFNALNALLQYHASLEDLQAMVFWLFGSLTKANWTKVWTSLAVLLLIVPLIIRDAWRLTAIRLGDQKAGSLGINVDRLRLKVMLTISILTAAAVCFVGTIGFIGLVAPHIARMVVGEDQRFFFPCSALSGALLLSAASVGSKLIVPGAIYPIGIITAFIGVPFFVSVILGRKKRYW
jgi:iron complex transport system permease protein